MSAISAGDRTRTRDEGGWRYQPLSVKRLEDSLWAAVLEGIIKAQKT